jgi:hypothetical protein
MQITSTSIQEKMVVRNMFSTPVLIAQTSTWFLCHHFKPPD